jgi:hypothetical protein
MKLKYFIVIIAAFAIFSCGSKNNGEKEVVNGVTIYKNGNFPSEKRLSIEAELMFTLNEDEYDTLTVIRDITAIETDESGNIYILDRRKSSVFKFGPDGKFLKNFGGRGNGPGEFMMPREILCADDTLYIVDQRQRKILTFNYEGEYLKDIIPLRDNGLPQNIEKLGNGNFAGVLFGFGGGAGRGQGPREMNYSVSVLNPKFEKSSDLISKKLEIDPREFNPLDHLNKFAAAAGNIYIAENTEDRIQINIYDAEGTKTGEIKKSYAKTLYSETEKLYLKKQMESMFRWREVDPSIFRYKKSVSNIFCLPDGHLLVESAGKRDDTNSFNFILDVYKDGVYLNTVDLNKDSDFYSNPEGFEKVMKGDKLFVYNLDDNIIYVYKLKILNKI